MAIIPLLFAWSVVASQLATIIASVQEPGAITAIIENINATLKRLLGRDIQISTTVQEQIQQLLVSTTSWVAGAALGVGTQIADLVSRLIIFLGIVSTLLPGYAEVIRRIKQLSPLDDALDTLFLHKIKVTVRAMFLGIFVIAVAQGLVSGLLFWLVGVPYAPLWTLLAVVASLFPLGASLIVIPIGICRAGDWPLYCGRGAAGRLFPGGVKCGYHPAPAPGPQRGRDELRPGAAQRAGRP